VRERPDAIDPRFRADVELQHVSFSYDGKLSSVEDRSFTELAGRPSRWSAQPAPASSHRRYAAVVRAFDPQSGIIKIDAWMCAAIKLTAYGANIGVGFQEALLFNVRSPTICAWKADATEEEMAPVAAGPRAAAAIHRARRNKFEPTPGARGRCCRGERQRLSIGARFLKNPRSDP